MSKQMFEGQDFIRADEWIPVMLEMLKQGKRMRISPHGYSMYPFLRSDQDEVILSCITKPLKRGDVVLYRRDNALYVLHRIHHIDQQGYYMVGDSQSEIEGPLREDQLLAIMVAFIRGNKTTYVTSRRYRIMACVWLNIRVVRRPIIAVFHWIRRITRTERKNKNA